MAVTSASNAATSSTATTPPSAGSAPSARRAGGDSTATQRFIAAGFGAAVAELTTLPVDVAKVRLQMQAPLADGSYRYTGFLQTMYKVGKDEGVSALWRGLHPALVRQISYTGLSFVIYEPVRNAIAGEGVPKDEIPFCKRVLAGGIAGSASIIAMNPTDVVKTQMQTQRGATGVRMDAVIAQVHANAGVAGFWRGWQPNAARCVIGLILSVSPYMSHPHCCHMSKVEFKKNPTKGASSGTRRSWACTTRRRRGLRRSE